MELLKKNIHMSRRKAYGENRMTLSEDFNIPDKKPDAAGLIQKRGEVKLEEVRTTEGQVQLSGTLEVHILYVSEGDERRLCRIQAEFPFEEKLLLPGAAAGDSVDVRQELEDLKVRLINSRKFSVQALISFEAELEELYDVQAGVELHGEASISTRSTRVTPISLAVRNKRHHPGEGGTFPSLQQAQHRRDSVGQRGASGRGCAGSGRVSGYQRRTFPLPSL